MPQHLAFTVQELMETITSSESLPRRLTSSQRKRRLEEERRLPEEDIKKAERAIRRCLWNRHLDNVSMSMRIRPSHCCMNEFFGNDGMTTQRFFSFLNGGRQRPEAPAASLCLEGTRHCPEGTRPCPEGTRHWALFRQAGQSSCLCLSLSLATTLFLSALESRKPHLVYFVECRQAEINVTASSLKVLPLRRNPLLNTSVHPWQYFRSRFHRALRLHFDGHIDITSTSLLRFNFAPMVRSTFAPLLRSTFAPMVLTRRLVA